MDNSVFISRQGKINFVDLAGSEMTKKTQSEGKTLEEANNINKSLMVLGTIIKKLKEKIQHELSTEVLKGFNLRVVFFQSLFRSKTLSNVQYQINRTS